MLVVTLCLLRYVCSVINVRCRYLALRHGRNTVISLLIGHHSHLCARIITEKAGEKTHNKQMRINRFEMEPIVTIISFLQATTVILLQITSTVSSNSKNQDLVVNSTISPSSPSTPCFAGLQCVFGTCSDNASRCNCYRGWAGLLCDAACPRDCGDRGLCAVGAEGQPYCKCHVGFSGVNCEKTELLMTVTPSSFKGTTRRFIVPR